MSRSITTPVKFRPLQNPSGDGSTSAAVVDEHSLHILWRHKILDPDSDLVSLWHHIFLVICIAALFIDPLYFYLPFVGGEGCLSTDHRLAVIVTFFRSIADLFYLLHMIVKFRTAFIAPSSRVFGRGDLVMDGRQIAMRYLKSDFVVDLAATLPIPQIVIWLVIPATNNAGVDHANNTLALFVLIQYIPRLFLIFPLNQKIVKTTGVVAKTPWAGAAYNLLLFMLASHIFGAVWYLCAIGRQFECWKTECSEENTKVVTCLYSFLDCKSLDLPERESWANATKVIKKCDASDKNADFKFGIFDKAFKTEAAKTNFFEKYLFCFWWGLRNLCSYGQTLMTSTYLGETLFSIVLCISGLILFSLLIGNMQTYLQSMSIKIEEWRIKQRDTDEWMRHRQLPEPLQERVRRFMQYKWFATRGVDEESILHSLPIDLCHEIQQHLCLSLVRRVPFFSQMDDQLLDAICERLVSSLTIKGTYIVQEGDPVNEMLFIIRGKLESSTTNGGRTGFFNSINLGPGDFCGEELLTWALMPSSSISMPSSTRTVRALTEVEAFALRAEDLKFVASQFKRLHSKKLQHAFRYYSHQWRTWGACFIQAAWRRFKKRKMARDLAMQEGLYYLHVPGQEEEGYYYDNEEQTNLVNYDGESGDRSSTGEKLSTSMNLGATFLASKFAANTRKGIVQKAQLVDPDSTSLQMPRMFKPDEPDFSVD
ncbi:putative potassium channel, voltage-dependent, ELK [Rosa chinensis]|uniref:Putative potassium channel, voltage-dependent, ELK n=1 Tax=Rosa chinensis TaxID=74649 RepID=A0A2P6S598_ROSCH|nr:cyclic nucleotide-gated ion channel 18 [Rosa chinensis]PRQ53842.1 putative potassium channel, voltage-dependent, ELK [Rosa chinensis]